MSFTLHRGLVAALLLGCSFPAYAQDERRVKIVLGEEAQLIDPCMASRSDVGRVVLQNISETLTVLDPRSADLRPRLAMSWTQVDDDTWQFKLREGVKFSDGTAFDAKDVAHSIARTTSGAINCEIGVKYFGGLDISTDVIDPQTIEITTNPAQPILPVLMSTMTIVPEETAMDEHTRSPVGTGPYIFDEWKAGQSISLSRNPSYWGETPEVEGATYLFRSDRSVAALMVENGEADIVPNIAVQDATNTDTDFAYPNSETFFLRIDTQVAPLNDRRVREALNLAIDREAFKGSILSSEVVSATQIVPPTTIGSNDNLTPYPYDPEKARSLIEEARADGVPVDTPIKLIGRTGIFPNGTEVMEAMQAMLSDAGFKVDLNMYDVAEWENFYTKPFAEDRSPQIIQLQHDNAKGDPVFSMFFKYHSDGLQSVLEDDEVDRLIDEATVATGETRADLWKQLFARLHDDIISDIVMFHMVGYTRVSERLDFEPSIATNSELQLAEISFR
ncbi:ABC transporter substrate-binding protein [Ahrensia kielensis]|uniref:ABC transporter substrate-binding protein n=1 Tax=Ahrensia kielensis TaxID=76980 RepID=UPI000380D999|nr:ABC transporter substrate-binding protein [Ahrensia kielensis]